MVNRCPVFGNYWEGRKAEPAGLVSVGLIHPPCSWLMAQFLTSDAKMLANAPTAFFFPPWMGFSNCFLSLETEGLSLLAFVLVAILPI